MFFCYTDESGDCGAYNPKITNTGSPYFILCGIIIEDKKWKVALDTLKSYRRRIARQGYLPYHIEFHCTEMIDPHKIKEFNQIGVPDRWKLIEEYAETIGDHNAFSVISVVIDKLKSTLTPEEYLTTATTKLYQAFDEFLKSSSSSGLVFMDRANEKKINTHVRKLMGTGASGEAVPGIKIGWIIEDPIFRVSSDSSFIQAADVIAYTLKEKEFPQAARKKFQADRIFQRKINTICYSSKNAGDDGIIRV